MKHRSGSKVLIGRENKSVAGCKETQVVSGMCRMNLLNPLTWQSPKRWMRSIVTKVSVEPSHARRESLNLTSVIQIGRRNEHRRCANSTR